MKVEIFESGRAVVLISKADAKYISERAKSISKTGSLIIPLLDMEDKRKLVVE